MCYCTPEIRTLFCSNCAVTLFTTLKKTQEELHRYVESNNSITQAYIDIQKENDQLREQIKELEKANDELEEAVIQLDLEKNPIYCPKCESCGEAGCCSPSQCKYVQNMIVFSDISKCFVKKLDSLQESPRFPYHHGVLDELLKDINKLFTSDGLYCLENWKSYKELEKENEEQYKTIQRYKAAIKALEVLNQ